MPDDEQGHDQDANEDPEEYLDRQFSRDGVISVFIGLSAGKIVEKLVAIVAGDPVAKLIGWAVVLPLALAVAWYWPVFERRFAGVLPWMDAD